MCKNFSNFEVNIFPKLYFFGDFVQNNNVKQNKLSNKIFWKIYYYKLNSSLFGITNKHFLNTQIKAQKLIFYLLYKPNNK